MISRSPTQARVTMHVERLLASKTFAIPRVDVGEHPQHRTLIQLHAVIGKAGGLGVVLEHLCLPPPAAPAAWQPLPWLGSVSVEHRLSTHVGLRAAAWLFLEAAYRQYRRGCPGLGRRNQDLRHDLSPRSACRIRNIAASLAYLAALWHIGSLPAVAMKEG